jgi:hypothetical protein
MTDPTSAPAARPTARPRLRTAAIVWGLVLAALGAGALWLAIDPSRVVALGLRALEAQPADAGFAIVGLVLVAGIAITLGSVLAAVHRGQDRARARREGTAQ